MEATARAREVRAKPRVAMAVADMRRAAVSRGTHLSSPVTKANIHLQAGVTTGAVALPVGAMAASRVRMQFAHPSRVLLTLDSPIRPGWLPGRPRWPAGRWLVGDTTAPTTLLMLQFQEQIRLRAALSISFDNLPVCQDLSRDRCFAVLSSSRTAGSHSGFRGARRKNTFACAVASANVDAT